MQPSVRECLKIILPLGILWLIFLGLMTWWAAIVSGLLFLLILFTIYFFRDPDPVVPEDEKIIVAPAYGKVVSVEELDDSHFQQGKMKRVAIFLSVIDVHVNHMPADGVIKKIIHVPGQFLDARDPHATTRNEHQAWWVETPRGPLVIRQIAGLIARRIVAFVKEGDELKRGARFGMIRFGSRTELCLPLECEILVKKGDHVYGANTPLARWP